MAGVGELHDKLGYHPLLAAAGVASIAKAIGAAAVKAVVTMVGITVAGRTLLRPLYKRVAGATTNLSPSPATTVCTRL